MNVLTYLTFMLEIAYTSRSLVPSPHSVHDCEQQCIKLVPTYMHSCMLAFVQYKYDHYGPFVLFIPFTLQN